MKKINLKLLAVTSFLTLLPMVVGLLLWKQLPDVIPSHFGFDGTADGFSSKAEVVFMIPGIMTLLHVFMIFVTSKDPKAKNVAPKMSTFIYWMIPLISGLVQLSIYGAILGWVHNPTRMGFIFISILFMILGNYLPKIKQNYTVGIKLPWTLNDEDNWNKTHRLAGKLWVLGGFIILVNEWLRWAVPFVFIGTILVMVFMPMVYSYWLSHVKEKNDKI